MGALGIGPVLYIIFSSAGTAGYYSNAAATRDGDTKMAVFPSGVWIHFAFVYVHSTSKFYSFRNGVLQYTDTTSVSRQSIVSNIGAGYYRQSYYDDNQWLRVDHFRVSDGIARWTSNFTPPTIDQY